MWREKKKHYSYRALRWTNYKNESFCSTGCVNTIRFWFIRFIIRILEVKVTNSSIMDLDENAAITGNTLSRARANRIVNWFDVVSVKKKNISLIQIDPLMPGELEVRGFACSRTQKVKSRIFKHAVDLGREIITEPLRQNAPEHGATDFSVCNAEDWRWQRIKGL